MDSTSHVEWLSNGGPARLWESLAEAKRSAERTAALFTELGQDAEPFVGAARRAKWAMDEMVSLYLQEAS